MESISLSLATRMNIDIKRYRSLDTRITKFKRQCFVHEDMFGMKPPLALIEIKKLESDHKYYRINYLILTKIIDQRLKSIKQFIDQLPTIAEHWEHVTKKDYIKFKSNITPLNQVFLDQLEEAGYKARQQAYMFRLRLALEEAVNKNWYIIFNTLTVTNQNYQKVWSKGSPCFKIYTKKIDRIVGKENHKYFAVTELGAKTERRHMHALHLLNNIPEKWKEDPNRAQPIPNKRIIDSMRSLWSYGYSSPIAVRTTAGDIWSRIGFRWPVERTALGFSPVRAGDTGKVAGYMIKYLTKALHTKDNRPWKIRQTQQLGMTILNKTMCQLSKKQLKQMLEISDQQILRIHQDLIPSGLLKTSSHRKILEHWKNDKSKITNIMTQKGQPSIMKRLNDLTQPIPLYNLRNIGNITTQNLRKQETSEYVAIQNIIDSITIQVTGYLERKDSHNYPSGVVVERI